SQLCTLHRGGRQLFVQSGSKQHAELVQQTFVSQQLLVVTTEWGAFIAGNERSRTQSVAAILSRLVERQPDQRLHTRQMRNGFAEVLVIKLHCRPSSLISLARYVNLH